ncbi:MAG: tRNA guanosine(34) transglycosylase Tgt, partial [Vicinamibacteria bacterium]
VGTYGAVRAMAPDELRSAGAEMLLANAYHLALRPGVERIEKLGGLHRFMSWPGPILTDSGGYQIFSLSSFREVSDEAVIFRSVVDGTLERFTPERVIEIENRLGADIIMPLDECSPYPVDPAGARRAVARTLAWAERSLRAHRRKNQALFGIIQGGIDLDLREESAKGILSLGFPGYAVGGLSVGEPRETLWRVASGVARLLPVTEPRYLMGVGYPVDLVTAVRAGYDLFDCVVPTRHGRNGDVFTSEGRLNLRNAPHAEDPRPIEEECPCRACRGFSRGAIRHFLACGEILGVRLCTEHNLSHYFRLFSRMRSAITGGEFETLARTVLAVESRRGPDPKETGFADRNR